MKRTNCFALLLLATLMFVFLFYPCLFEGKMYAYRDIGRDTINMNLPSFVFELRSMQNGETDQYRLDSGLGRYCPSPLYQYISPLNLPLLLGEENLHWGILLSTYIKCLITALFAWLFFSRLFHWDAISITCALLWTYSGYTTVWGQHYVYMTAICAVTVATWGLQLFLDDDRKALLIIPALAYLMLVSYFHLWIWCFFALFYSVGTLVLRGKKPIEILKKAALCILCGLWAFLMAGEAVLPAAEELFASTRLSNMVEEAMANGLLYPVNYLTMFCARLLSVNMLGIGNKFSGVTNYYELAILGTGLLFFLSTGVLLFNSGTRKPVVVFLALGAVLLCTPYFSKVIASRTTTQRWTFILILAEIIAIGCGLESLFDQMKPAVFWRKLLNATLFMDLAVGTLILIVKIGEPHYGYTLATEAVIQVSLFMLLYNLTVLFGVSRYLTRGKHGRTGSLVRLSFVALACIEVLVTSYPSINDREMITVDEWHNGIYYDGTGEIAQWIREQDSGIYRVGKTYESQSRNDALIQNYNGTAIYSATNSRWLINYYCDMGYTISNSDTATGSNYIRFLTDHEFENDLLGVKYIISRNSVDRKNLSNQGELVIVHGDETDNDGFVVYKNDTVNSFGYLYDSKAAVGDIAEYGSFHREILTTRSYYETKDVFSDIPLFTPYAGNSGSENTMSRDMLDSLLEASQSLCLPDISESLGEGFCRANLINFPAYTINCSKSESKQQQLFRSTGGNMTIEFGSMPVPEKYSPLRMIIVAYADKTMELKVSFAEERQEFTTDNSTAVLLKKGLYVYPIDLFGLENISKVRINVASDTANAVLLSAAVESIDVNTVRQNVKELYNNGVVNIRQEGNQFVGVVDNHSDHDRMLCLPLIFSDHWSITVDGASAEIHNINGGLTGTIIQPGEHSVRLVYNENSSQLGRKIGIISFSAYVLVYTLTLLRGRRRRKVFLTTTERERQ